MKTYCIYILTSQNNKVMYVGVTSNLEQRIYQHLNGQCEGFTKRYNVTKLVYFEQTSDVNSAIAREKEIKGWRREKKNALVESANPHWLELSVGL
ncbi:MAG: GIY-YIG nuclease family protein [Cellvibrionaceae bacterium]